MNNIDNCETGDYLSNLHSLRRIDRYFLLNE